MIILYIIILAILIVLRLSANVSKPPLPHVETGYSRVFLAPAVLIHTWAAKISDRRHTGRDGSVRNCIKNRKLSTDLQTLHPGESPETQLANYRIEIISTAMLILGVGALVCLMVSVMSRNEGVLQDGDVIYRNSYGGMDVEADLSAGVAVDDEGEDTIYPVSISLPARVYSYEEADVLFSEMSDEIDTLLLGKNSAPDHILYPVDPVRRVEGYPFTISWECSDYNLLDHDGLIHNEELTEPVMVTVTGDCEYRHDHWYIVRDLMICPRELTIEEAIEEALMDAVSRADTESVSEDKISLPQTVSSRHISWEENISDISPMIMLAVLMLTVLIIPFKESELSSRIKARSASLLIEYPAFVSQLTLYMGAGMSVRNCLLRFGNKAGSRPEKDRSYLDRELIITAHELEVGISESEAVTRFGKRCGTREYMRFSALLIQNMKKGSTDLVRMLKEESEDAFTLRKNEARKLGEEASTKLLLPMVMMLTVVMIIIMVPAYMSFST